MALINYNAKAYEAPSNNFEPLPEGEYDAIIAESEVKETKAGTGNYLKLTLEIKTPAYAGRKLFETVTLQNPNEQAFEIGMKTLKAICVACGKGDSVVKDSAELHNHPMTVFVKQKDEGQYGIKNVVKAWKPYSGSTYTPTATPKATPKAPWQK